MRKVQGRARLVGSIIRNLTLDFLSGSKILGIKLEIYEIYVSDSWEDLCHMFRAYASPMLHEIALPISTVTRISLFSGSPPTRTPS